MNYSNYYNCINSAHIKGQSCGTKRALDLPKKEYQALIRHIKKNEKTIAQKRDWKE